ncbi:unnamed protein product [Nyctereutes procyonoides]|uniref:(raccoon dog) hypothetical protein n=1 Tax=Nyctereutes procyonoides TaxID=34880 RepID=A0A811ZS11_NYCPR|nr:unnamed protein product [Nyctereutes procyonoides]
MGSPKSIPVTSVQPPQHKYLAGMADLHTLKEHLKSPIQAQDSNPHSPILPPPPPSPLVKELNKVYETEAHKSNLPRGPVITSEAPSSELDFQTELPSKQVFSKEETRQLTESPMASQGSKLNRKKSNGKVLERSHFTIQQDDNQSSSLSGNVRELKEGGILGTALLKTRG